MKTIANTDTNTPAWSVKLLRQQAKALGYKLQFKTNPLKESLVAVGFYPPGAKESTVNGTVFSGDFYEQHRAIFELLAKARGQVMADTGQKLV